MPKISKEIAQEQLDVLLDYYLVDLEDVDQTEGFYRKKDDTEEAKRSFCKRILRYIQHGLVEISSEEGLTVIQRLRNPVGDITQISYKTLDGKAQTQMKHASDNDYAGKILCLMGALSQIPGGATTLAKCSGPDAGVIQCLGLFFLTV